jgi:hypothetical protein
MTRNEVIAVTGPAGDRFVVEMMGPGDGRADLLDTVARARSDGSVFTSEVRSKSGTATRVCEIIEAADAAATDSQALEDQRL